VSGYGYHWTPCPGRNRGGGPGGLVLLVLALVVISAIARAGEAAASVIGKAFGVGLVVVICVAALAVLAGLAAVSVRVGRQVRRRAHRRALAAPVRLVGARPGARLPGGPRRALPPLRNHVSPYPRNDTRSHVVTRRVIHSRRSHRDGGRS
jgi:hypothetical protein